MWVYEFSTFKTVPIGWWHLTLGNFYVWTKWDDVLHAACWPKLTYHGFLHIYPINKLSDPFPKKKNNNNNNNNNK